MKKNIIITGGSGFIGTNLFQYYLEKGFEVLNLDRLPPRNEKHGGCFQETDILNEAELVRAVKEFNPDYIIHMAARTDLDETTDIKGYAANIQGVKNMIAACRNVSNLSRIIFASSMLVCRLGYIPENEHDYAPGTKYGESKVLSEKIIRHASLDCS